MAVEQELGINIIHNPTMASALRFYDLKERLDWGNKGLNEISRNPLGELSDKAIQAQRRLQKSRLSELRDQINGETLMVRSYTSSEPLSSHKARLRDLFLHRRVMRAGVRKAEIEGCNEDYDEFLERTGEVQEALDKDFPL